MALAARDQRGNATNIHAMRHTLDVIGVAAWSDPAFVIALQSIRYRPVTLVIDHDMAGCDAPGIVPHTGISLIGPSALIDQASARHMRASVEDFGGVQS